MQHDTTPRIGNLPRAEWTDAARAVFAFWGEPDAWNEGSKTNMSMVQANHPDLAIAYNTFGKHLLLASTIPVRPRELIVLRTAWLLKSEYEWHYHVGYALNAGLSEAEILAVKDGAEASAWDGKDEDCAVLRAVDELYGSSQISDSTWAALTGHFDRRQMMDLVFTIGNYVMLGWSINAFGVPLEDGVDRIDWDLKAASGAPLQVAHRPFEKEPAA